MEHVREFKTQGASWIDAASTNKKLVGQIAKKYNLLPQDAAEVLPPIQRSRLVERPDYIFMILLFPVYDRASGQINTEEIDFFISKNALITFHHNQIPAVKNFFDKCAKNKQKGTDISGLLYELLDGLLNYCLPMITHLNLDLETVESLMFKKFERKTTVDLILRIKTNIFDFQRILQSHEYVLSKLMQKAGKFFSTKTMENNFIHLVEYTKEINLSLQSFKDEINALHEANTTLVEYRVNEILKVLTIFSVIVFPLTLLAAVFGMNVEEMPIVSAEYAFWKLVGIMVGGAVVMLGVFKWKKWI